MRLLMLAQNLWTLAIVLALMKMRLDFFYERTDRNEPLVPRGSPLILPCHKPPSMCLLEFFPWYSVKEHYFHQQHLWLLIKN